MEVRLSRSEIVERIKKLIVDVPNFPSEGIIFKDITPVLQNGIAFQDIVNLFSSTIPKETTQLLAIESRGFIFASAIAHHLGIGITLVRKPGKLPRPTISHTYALEYGEDTLQIHKDSISKKDKVIVIDDVLATGGTAQATEVLCEKLGAHLLGHRFLIEIDSLKGRDKLSATVDSFIHC
ncbi:MAG: adenine phosphoribosyltransferase [Bdellovibrionales bacterium]|nr:adenine phosphoribosyltransferase [Bdellovibrionales bacterium]